MSRPLGDIRGGHRDKMIKRRIAELRHLATVADRLSILAGDEATAASMLKAAADYRLEISMLQAQLEAETNPGWFETSSQSDAEEVRPGAPAPN
jgi:hypothetical protein